MADSDEVLSLLQIAEISLKWDKLKPIHDHAMTRLLQIVESHKPKPVEEERRPNPAVRQFRRPTESGDAA